MNAEQYKLLSQINQMASATQTSTEHVLSFALNKAHEQLGELLDKNETLNSLWCVDIPETNKYTELIKNNYKIKLIQRDIKILEELFEEEIKPFDLTNYVQLIEFKTTEEHRAIGGSQVDKVTYHYELG